MSDIETKLREVLDGVEEGLRLAEVGEYLYNACAYSYGDGRTEPREYGIEWQWQQAKPDEYGQGQLLAASTKWHAEQAADGIGTEATKLRGTIAALRKQVSDAVGERDRQMRRATNAEYMAAAYRNMLGPKGLEVAAMWERAHVNRVHFDWGPDALKLSGEQRAETILAMSVAPSRQASAEEIDAPMLLEVARECEELGISLIARVEWEPGESGITQTGSTSFHSIGQYLTQIAAHSHGNIDKLCLTLLKNRDVSQSIFLASYAQEARDGTE